MGRVARAKTGLHHGGGHIPIGYEYEDGHLVINPYEAEQVRKIYEWYLAGDSLKTITDKLQEVGYTNKYSSYNSWTSVRNILGNETYTGRLHFGDVIVDNAHEPIISKEQFDAAQVLRGKRQEQYGGQAFQSKHLLAGLIYCGHCGGRYYLRFLSTPSARRATAKTETKSLFSNKLYNILHEFRRALIYNGSKNYPNHAK